MPVKRKKIPEQVKYLQHLVKNAKEVRVYFILIVTFVSVSGEC